MKILVPCGRKIREKDLLEHSRHCWVCRSIKWSVDSIKHREKENLRKEGQQWSAWIVVMSSKTRLSSST